jgi:hypothetical protein
MQYATRYGVPYGTNTTTGTQSFDPKRLAYIGWEQTIQDNPNYKDLWDPKRLRQIQNKITDLLDGVGDNGRPIIVPLDTIASVLSQCIESNSPPVGDIYSRFTIEQLDDQREDTVQIIDRTINIITTQIRNEIELARHNRSLTIWSTLYGEGNQQGLRQHPPIKIRHRRPQPMMFNMNY